MGYGSRALEALDEFYTGKYFNLNESETQEPSYKNTASFISVRIQTRRPIYSILFAFFQDADDLLTETPTVRSVSSMPPLLQRLSERKPEVLDYLGVSYGLTSQLLRYAFSYATTFL